MAANYKIEYSDGNKTIEISVIEKSLKAAVISGYDKIFKTILDGHHFKYTGKYEIKNFKTQNKYSNCAIAVITPNGEFPSISDAAKANNISPAHAANLIRQGRLKGWEFKEKSNDKIPSTKINKHTIVTTPNGKYDSVIAAAHDHGMTAKEVYRLLKQDKLKDWRLLYHYRREK